MYIEHGMIGKTNDNIPVSPSSTSSEFTYISSSASGKGNFYRL